MRHSFVYGALCALGVMIAAIPAKAVVGTTDGSCSGGPITVSIFNSSDTGISSISCVFDVDKITVNETWGSAAAGFLQFNGLDQDVFYILRKNITNNSGVDFTSITNELLDPTDPTFADNSHDGDDAVPIPAFIPSGFGTSNNRDGLDFAQGATATSAPVVPRTSDVFAINTADELLVRDFLDFSDGTIGMGVTGYIEYGLRDRNGIGDADCTGPNNLTG